MVQLKKLQKNIRQQRSYLNDLLVSVQHTGLKRTLISIVWTAGPVTLIAIFLGYYISHGTIVPLTTIVYFSIYVFIVGVSGFISKIILDTINIRHKDQAEQTFLFIVDISYQMLTTARNLKLLALSLPLKGQMISTFLLSKSHPTTTEIFFAMEPYFGVKVARFAELMQIYENNGIPTDSLEAFQQIENAQTVINKNTDISDNLRDLALRKVKGDHISLNEGVPRAPGFLIKVLNSGGQHSLFDLDDSSNVIILCLELLADRKIYYFKTLSNFSHLKKDRLFSKIEHIRQKIRLKHWLSLGIIEQIYLTAQETSPDLSLKYLLNLSIDVHYNLNLMRQALNLLNLDKLNRERKHSTQQLKYRFNQTTLHINQLVEKLDHYMITWHNLASTTQNILDDKQVQIKLATIQLENKEKIKLSNYLKHTIESFNQLKDEKSIKIFALTIVKYLMKPLSLDNPLIVYAIEASNAANFSSVEANYSAKQKAELTHNLSNTVYANIPKLKKRYQQALAAQYQNY